MLAIAAVTIASGFFLSNVLTDAENNRGEKQLVNASTVPRLSAESAPFNERVPHDRRALHSGGLEAELAIERERRESAEEIVAGLEHIMVQHKRQGVAESALQKLRAQAIRPTGAAKPSVVSATDKPNSDEAWRDSLKMLVHSKLNIHPHIGTLLCATLHHFLGFN
jgi:hypothetical protein